jgi:hypothetical protein
MDIPRRSAAKSAPLLRHLASLLGPTASKSSLATHIYSMAVDQDNLNASRHILYVDPPSYWFDNPDYYTDERFEGHRREAEKYFREVVRLLREDDMSGVGGSRGPLLGAFWQAGAGTRDPVDRIVGNFAKVEMAIVGAYGIVNSRVLE